MIINYKMYFPDRLPLEIYLKQGAYLTPKGPYFRDKKRYYSSSNSDLPELAKSRAGLGDEDSSTVPDTVSDKSKDERNKAEAALNSELHDKLGIDTAYNVQTKVKVPDLSQEDLEKLAPRFEKCSTDDEAQYFYDGHLSILKRARNANKESGNHDRLIALEISNSLNSRDESRWNQVAKSSGINANVNTTCDQPKKINAKYDELDRNNNEYYMDRVSDLNLAAQSYRDYENLNLQRDNEYYEMLQSDRRSNSSSNESSVSVAEISETSNVSKASKANNTSNHLPKQDSSEVVQDTFDSSDYYDDV